LQMPPFQRLRLYNRTLPRFRCEFDSHRPLHFFNYLQPLLHFRGNKGTTSKSGAGLVRSTKLETRCAVALDGDSCASHNERAFRRIRRTDIPWVLSMEDFS
jgi:hypothetical protein